jgi:hypothetical protein
MPGGLEKLTNDQEEHVASIFRVEELNKQQHERGRARMRTEDLGDLLLRSFG